MRLFCFFFMQVVHIFSHIHQTYVIEGIVANQSDITEEEQSDKRWVSKEQFLEAAVSTAMKKVFYFSSCMFLLTVLLKLNNYKINMLTLYSIDTHFEASTTDSF